MRYWLFAILILFIQKGLAQNLVPNPSFEEYTMCPFGAGQMTFVSGWYSATLGSPDYFNTCSTNAVSVPVNNFGEQYPNSGNGYTGMGIYNDQNQSVEYIGCELLSQLEPNKIYCISLTVSFAEVSEYSIDCLSIFFSNDTQTYNTSSSINETPQVIFHQSLIDSLNWIKLTGYYSAIGGERYMTIGNFYQFPFNAIKIKDNNTQTSYIYIDDIDISECNIPDIEAIVRPNVFTPNNDGYNDVFEIQFLPPNSKLTIYNRWGSQIYQSENYKNNWSGDNLSDGVYFYILTLPSGNSTKGTVTMLKNGN